MEAAAKRRDISSREPVGPCAGAGELERRFDALGAGVAEEHARVAGLGGQRVREIGRGTVRIEVRDVREGARLLRDRARYRGGGVAERIDGDAADEIEILPAGAIRDP